MACTYLYNDIWYTEDELRRVYNQGREQKTLPSVATPGTMKKIREFLDRIGVEVKSLSKITYNGQTLGINGLADPLNGLIQVVEGKEDIALPEEAMHMAVELIEQQDPKLFKEMMDRVGRYNLFDLVMAEYQNNPFYQTKEGRPDIRKIKKEAIGKILTQTVINKNQDTNEKPELLDQTRTWWQKVVDFLKDLFLRAGFNPFESAASKVLENRLEGDFDSVDGVFASRSPNAVNASLKLVAALRDPKAARWFNDMFQKGNKPQFLQKIQQDLQAPKAQVEMLKKLIQGREYNNIGELITDVITELSYTVEVNVALDRRFQTEMESARRGGNEYWSVGDIVSYKNEEYKIIGIDQRYSEDDGLYYFLYDIEPLENIYDPETNPQGKNPEFRVPAHHLSVVRTAHSDPSQYYQRLNVDGGINYRENEIKTPDITPSIKGHAVFASDQGIGWFRSDDQVKGGQYYKGGVFEGEMISSETIGGTPTKTRRILEIQSDLFQKGRDKADLVGKEPFDTMTVDVETTSEEFEIEKERNKRTETPENQFLQLLNRENNWVTFFVKAIIQDSAKKGYENVRFPGGSTANKIEGQETVEEFIATKQKRLEEIKDLEDVPAGKKITWSIIPPDRSGKIGKFNTKEEAEIYLLESINPTIISYRDKMLVEPVEQMIPAKIYSIERERLNAEIVDAQEGRTKFSAIASFYETTIQNILKKQGYKPKEVTDEYGNKWFEIKLEEQRDLSDFYFQISGQDLATRIIDKDANIIKKGDEFEINGNKIRNSVQKEIQDFYRKRIGAASADKALKGFKQQTENKVQVDIKDILTRYIDDDNKLRITPLAQVNPSSVDPGDNGFYMTLESHLSDRLNAYEPGTKFVHSVNLYNGMNTAGHTDLIAITPQGKVDIFQFKVPQLSRGAFDVPVYRQEAYNFEIEQIRKILQSGYGVAREDFRQTRAIPIKADYERVSPNTGDMKLSKLTVGNINVALIQDDLLLPISSESELSEDDKFDKFIKRLKALAQKIGSERVAPEQRIERTQRVAQLVAAIRKLQIKKDGNGVLSSAKNIIKLSKERIKTLKEKIANIDPNVATIAELNKISEEILSDKDQIEVYKDLYQVFKNTFTDDTVESQDMIKDSREVSDDANDIIEDYWTLSVQFRTKKLAAKVDIKDEFNPEKKLTWYRRMIRSLSQSSIKAGAILWRLVERINGRFKTEFLDRIDELGKIEEEVSEWMKGKSVKDLYDKIFQYNDKGEWNGKVIQKIDRKFYTDLIKAQENRDHKWIKDNIDIDKYKEWFVKEHARRIEDSKTARYSADDAENNRLVQQKLQDFVDTFHIDFKKGVGTYNWKLKEFPKQEIWNSEAYKELEKNPPLLKLYEYYRKRLEESWDLGMLHEHNGWSWFPNVRRNLLEKLSSAPAGDKLKSLFGSIRIEAEDQTFGKIDPLTGKPVDEVHANFVSDLGQYVQDVDGNYFKDYSEKSMDIFKVLALWDAEILKYRLKTESEGIARLLYYTEADPRRVAYQSTSTGKLKREPGTNRPVEISNEVNAAYVKEHIDAVYYGKGKSDEFDVVINIPYKAAVEKINKLFGSEILTVPKEETVRISGIKTIETMNRYFVTKTLGLNVMTSIAQLFGGSINTFINQGLYFNKKDMLEAELKYVSGKFYTNDEDKKLAGLVSFIHPYTEDRTGAMIRNLSVSKMVQHLSSDHLFFLQRGSDNWVNTIVALATIKNTMVIDGKLVNIRDFARKELGHADKYEGTYEEVKEFDVKLEKRVLELQKSPQALIHFAKVVNDQIVIEGVDRNSDTLIRFRQQILEMIKDALGNTSSEDLSLYKRSIMWQSFFMFKNWIPRMFDVRFGSLKYSPGTDKYEYGRMRMLVNGIKNLGLGASTSLIAKLGNDPKPLIEVAKKEYARKKATFAEEQEDFNMTEAEFIDMYVKGVRSEIKELLLAAGLMGILITMRINSPDTEDDPELKGVYKWALRGLDKLTDELTFMYTPSSFTSILNGSVFPAVGILVEFERFFTSVIKKLFWNVMGDEEKAEKTKVLKHVFRALPVTKEIVTYLAMFNDDIAKEYGIRMNTNYGSVR